MKDEGHRQEDGAVVAAGARDGQAPEQAVAGTAGDEAAVRKAGVEGDGAAARSTGAADGGTAPGGTRSAGGGAAGHEDGADAASPGPEPSEASPPSLEDELAEARRAAQEHLDKALRAQAELENVRRRMARDVESAHKFALERFVSELLPVRDSLEFGLAAAQEASAASIAEGVELTLRMLEQAMEKFGVEAVDPAGEPFDPAFHQAVTMQESDAAESGAVLTVVQKGYLLNERLVRPAMVIVAK